MIREKQGDLNWQSYYSACLDYEREHGNLDVPERYVSKSGVRLGVWIVHIRQLKKKDSLPNYLTSDRLKLLDKLNMIWDYSEYWFEVRYKALVEYKKRHGNCEVPQEYVTADGLRIGSWVYNVQLSYKGIYIKCHLTDEQYNALIALGVNLETYRETQWKTSLEEAKIFYEENGHIDAVFRYESPSGFKLGHWLAEQRKAYKDGRLSEQRKTELDKLGMIWNCPAQWEDKYTLAKKYFELHGDLKMPKNHKIGKINLKKWVNEQRRLCQDKEKINSLSTEQLQLLEKIGIKPILK